PRGSCRDRERGHPGQRARRARSALMATLARGFRNQFDWPLFVAVAGIAVIGVVNLYSATSVGQLARSDIYIQQIYWLTLGAVVATAVAAVDYRAFERQGWFVYVA